MRLRLELRWLDESDRSQLLTWANSTEVRDYMYRDHEISPEEHAIWFDAAIVDPNKFIVMLDGVPVGFAQYSIQSEKDKRWTWGHYLADPACRGKGLGKILDYIVSDRIFSQGANKIAIEAFSWNIRAIRCHARFGYRVEGYLVDHVRKGGKWHDVTVMGLTAAEWDRIKVLRADNR